MTSKEDFKPTQTDTSTTDEEPTRQRDWIISGGNLKLPIIEEFFGISHVRPPSVTTEQLRPDLATQKKNEELIWEAN